MTIISIKLIDIPSQRDPGSFSMKTADKFSNHTIFIVIQPVFTNKNDKGEVNSNKIPEKIPAVEIGIMIRFAGIK